MANTNPVNTNCYVLRSCTTGDDTVLVTSVTASPLLTQYLGQHIQIDGYGDTCFSIELIESGCINCSNSVTLAPIKTAPNPVCTCTVVYNYYVLTPCDPSLPSFYTAQNLYPYDGTTITFFGQGGVCYTVNGAFNIPQGISVIGVQCPEACQCVIPDCGCPDGYTLNPETGLCDGFIETTPTGGTQFYVIEKAISTGVWGNEGAWFFDDVSTLPKPLTILLPVPPPGSIPPYTIVDDLGIPCIIDSIVINSLWTTRLEVISIWAQGVDQANPAVGPIGFSFCYDFPESKIYYFGISADDAGTLAIDGNLIIDIAPFVTWTVLPIFITAGQHILNLTVQDIGSSVSGIGFEIYDVSSYAILQACTTANGTSGPTDLNQYILFTTLDKLTPPGQTWDTGVFNPIPGENYGYNCPDGSVFSNCGTPACIQKTSVPQLPCFTFKITFCDGVNLDPIITNTDLTQYLGAVYTICYTIPNEPVPINICACGSVSRVDTEVAPDFTGTFSTIFYDCCEKCTQVCYLLEDCQGAVDPIITCTDLSNYVNQIVKLSNCGDICWKVSESETCDDSILLGTVIENFVPTVIEGKACVYETNISPEFVTFSSLQIMINNTEYVIDFTTFIQLFTDLNNLNLGTFSLSGSYLAVTGNNNYGLMCLVRPPKPKICTEPVCSTYTKYCTYKSIRVGNAPTYKLPAAVFTIIINGITYTGNIPSLTINDFFTYLNSLNLGVFVRVPSAPVLLIVRVYGNETYGNIQFAGVVTDNTCIENENLDFAQACTDCLPPLPPEPVLDLHIRRIKPGYFSPNSCITTEYMDRINCNFAKQVYDAMLINRYGITVCCDHDVDTWDVRKQVLDFELLTDPNLCKSTLCYCPAPCLIGAFLTVNPTCIKPNLISASFNSCYPPIITSVTIELPLPCKCFIILNGTPGNVITYIDCEDVEVSLTLTVVNTFLCAKEILTICEKCSVTELSNDCALGECACIPVCYEVTTNGSDIPRRFTYLNCETGNLIQQFTTPNTTYYVCSGIIPYGSTILPPVVLPNDCALGECVAPPPICNCWGVTPTGKFGTFVTFTYDTCDGIPVTVSNVTLPVEVCSPASPNVIFTDGTYVISSGGTCNTDCGITGIAICTCYTIEVTSNDAFIANVEIETYTTTCLGVDPGPFPITTNITSSDPILYICSERAPIISLASSNAEVLITMRDGLDCATGNCVAPPTP